jgi:hypothetical protein
MFWMLLVISRVVAVCASAAVATLPFTLWPEPDRHMDDGLGIYTY